MGGKTSIYIISPLYQHFCFISVRTRTQDKWLRHPLTYQSSHGLTGSPWIPQSLPVSGPSWLVKSPTPYPKLLHPRGWAALPPDALSYIINHLLYQSLHPFWSILCPPVHCLGPGHPLCLANPYPPLSCTLNMGQLKSHVHSVLQDFPASGYPLLFIYNKISPSYLFYVLFFHSISSHTSV